MRQLFILPGLILATISCYSQCDSTFFRYASTKLFGVSLITGDTIVCSGWNANFIKSVDGGITWKNIPAHGLGWAVNGVQFTSKQIGYAVDNQGAILKTEDQGENWFPVYLNTGNYKEFSSLYFFNDSRGYVLDWQGRLLTTADGGVNWTDTYIDYGLNSISFFDDSLGFIAGHFNSIFRTTNGGKSWASIDISNIGFNKQILKIKMASAKIGYAVGSSIVLKTIDGGLTWKELSIPIQDHYRDLYVYDTKNVFFVGGWYAAAMLHTRDGGNSWARIYRPSSPPLTAITANDNGKKLVAVGGGTQNGFGRSILYSVDSGKTWLGSSVNTESDISYTQFINDSTGFMNSGGFLFKTNDYAESWKGFDNQPEQSDIYLLDFLDSQHGYVTGTAYNAPTLFETVNGGKSWIARVAPEQASHFGSRMKFINSSTGFICASSLYRTQDSGKSWSKKIQSELFFNGFAITNSGKAFTVGYGGAMYTSMDTGVTWNKYDLNTDRWLTMAYFYNDSLGFIGTSDSVLYRTKDGGISWEEIHTAIHNLPMQDMLFLDGMNGYILAGSSTSVSEIFRTKDGGNTWYMVKQETGFFKNLTGFKTVYTAGRTGMILKTDKLSKPSIPGYISGPEKSCVGETTGYSTLAAYDDRFMWTLSDGGTNIYNNNKDTVKWTGEGEHILTVTSQNACGVSSPRMKTIEVINFKPQITQTDSVLTATPGLGYQWYFNNMVIKAEQGGTAQTIVTHIPGLYKVDVVSPYGCTRTSDEYNYQVILATQLIKFTGNIVNDNANLNWSFADTKDLSYINIERSTNGMNFVKIASIDAANSPAGNSYSYLDQNIDLLGSQDIYYRIETVDKDGMAILSNVVLLKLSDRFTVTAAPNPFTKSLKLKIYSSMYENEQVQIQISNSQGVTVVLNKKILSYGENVFDLNLSGKPAGLYMVKLVSAHFVKQLKVLKQ